MGLMRVGIVLFMAFGQFFLITAKQWKCGFPGTPAYGRVKPDNGAYSVGDVVTYTCRVGYILLGAPISKCTDDGSWSEEVPICDDSMTTLGVAFSTPTVPGHSAEMAIDRDKETCAYLKPKYPRWWRIDLGEEHKVLSVAVTMISPDKNVKFTVFVTKTEGTAASYKRCAAFTGKFGTQTIVLSCSEGKGIVGQQVHIEDHLRSESFFEICEVEVQVEKAIGYDCGRPSRSLYSISYEPENELVEYDCMKGYQLKGNLFRSCLNTGQWSGNPPVCEPIYCDDIDPLENGEIELSHGNSGPPLEGAVVIYKCDEGYKLEGPFTRNCLKDGSWSEKEPQCKAIRCPIPEGKELGGVYRLVNKTNSMGSMAMLRCKGGKREGDYPYIVCTEEGEWTKPEVRCILPARAAYYEKEDGPKIVNQGAVIFGMVVAAIMIVVVLVAMYLYGRRRNGKKPELPSRLNSPPVPPPRPPPRMGFKNAFLGLMSRDSVDSQSGNPWKTHSLPKESPVQVDEIGWKTQSLPANANEGGWNKLPSGDALPEDKDAVVEVEVVPHDSSYGGKGKHTYESLPEENEDASPDDIVLDVEERVNAGSPSEPKSTSDYAAVDYEKKRQSRLLKEQDSLDSSTSAGSPLPPEESKTKEHSKSPTLPKRDSPSETEESESEEEEDSQTEIKPRNQDIEAKEEEERKVREEEEQRKAKEEEERKAKEEEEKKAKEEEEKKAKEEKEKNAEEEKKKAEPPRRRRLREDPPPPVMERPVLRRVRKF